MTNLFTNLNKEEEASLVGGSQNNITRRRVGTSASNAVAIGGNGGTNISALNGNQVAPVAVGGNNTAGGNQSANSGRGSSASASSTNNVDIAVS